MNQTEMRQVAIRAIRSEARQTGREPETFDAETALTILDDIFRIDPEVIASLWYGDASDNQIKLFKREWNAS